MGKDNLGRTKSGGKKHADIARTRSDAAGGNGMQRTVTPPLSRTSSEPTPPGTPPRESNRARKKRLAEEEKEEVAYLSQTADEGYSWYNELFITRFPVAVFQAIRGAASDAANVDHQGFMKKLTVAKTTDWFKKNKTMIAVWMGILAMMYIMAGQEAFNEGSGNRQATDLDYYAILDVPRDADLITIRRAYKKLSLRYHPDKNPDVDPQIMSDISEANEFLTDKEKREVYDRTGGKAENNPMGQTGGMELTSDNVNTLQSAADPVAVFAYDINDGSSKTFGPYWESSIHDEPWVQFARVALKQETAAVSRLPVYTKWTPHVQMIARGQAPEEFRFSPNDEDKTAGNLNKWLRANYPKKIPTMTRKSNKNILHDWLASTTPYPKVLLVGPQRKGYGMMIRRRIAYQWQDIFNMRHMSETDFRDSFTSKTGELFQSVRGESLVVFPAAGSDAEQKPLRVIPLPEGIEGDEKEVTMERWSFAMQDLAQITTPTLTLQNVNVLCKSTEITRTYCLVVPDSPLGAAPLDVEELRKKLMESRRQYEQEAKDAKESSDIDTEQEEHIQIQMVRLKTKAAMFNLQPRDVVGWNGHYQNFASAHLQGASAFLIEKYANQGKAMKRAAKDYNDIYQAISYGDLTLDSLGEDFVFEKILPNVEESVRQHFRRQMYAWNWGFFLIFVVITLSWIEGFVHVVQGAVTTKKWQPLAIMVGATTVAFAIFSPPFCKNLMSLFFL